MAATIDLLMETARQLTVAQQREAIYRLAKEVMTRTGDHSLHVAGPSAGEDDLYVIPTPAHEFKITVIPDDEPMDAETARRFVLSDDPKHTVPLADVVRALRQRSQA